MFARIIVVFLLVCSFSSIALAQDSEGNQPIAYINTLVQDLGNVYEQDVYKYTFVVENRGKAELIIENVKPG
ncbi:MAG: hypothetical protein GTO51_08390 [Candidatus Latescibacteria bacterium]|nr:hypothetical protein [Candidatus Latescibacterota bacterium]NIM21971.1 hypothetical protein [Candidatus Latescibacterota bacterium]NIM65989.1 hypothetical protein [Candidatus Latescibacterota bacterium]NIO02397.1 hypothetical protein [Candidatus Latescibacterota bacterium]NIO29307.1 hypothetical protein [Candidatus Latescibacterota bacterium]